VAYQRKNSKSGNELPGSNQDGNLTPWPPVNGSVNIDMYHYERYRPFLALLEMILKLFNAGFWLVMIRFFFSSKVIIPPDLHQKLVTSIPNTYFFVLIVMGVYGFIIVHNIIGISFQTNNIALYINRRRLNGITIDKEMLKEMEQEASHRISLVEGIKHIVRIFKKG
jgi:hypothetical protein